jgi:hypothetical protein
MRKLKLAMKKNSTERNLQAKEMLKSLQQHLSEALGAANYLRNNFDDVLDLNKIKDLFEISKKLDEFQKKV